MMSPGAIIAALVLAFGLFAGGVGTGIRWEEGRTAIETKHITEAVTAANLAAAEAISKIKVTNKTIQAEVQREIRTETVYSDANCAHSDNGLRLVNEALSARPNPAGGLKLPRADPAR